MGGTMRSANQMLHTSLHTSKVTLILRALARDTMVARQVVFRSTWHDYRSHPESTAFVSVCAESRLHYRFRMCVFLYPVMLETAEVIKVGVVFPH